MLNICHIVSLIFLFRILLWIFYHFGWLNLLRYFWLLHIYRLPQGLILVIWVAATHLRVWLCSRSIPEPIKHKFMRKSPIIIGCCVYFKIFWQNRIIAYNLIDGEWFIWRRRYRLDLPLSSGGNLSHIL